MGTIAAGVKGSDGLGRGPWFSISEPAVAALHDREAEARSGNGGVVGRFGAKFGIVAAAEQAGRLFPGQWLVAKVWFGVNDGTIGNHGGPSVSRARGERGRIAEERVKSSIASERPDAAQREPTARLAPLGSSCGAS